MASIRERPRAGRPPAYCIRWRDPEQGGKETSLTFEDRGEAERFLRILNQNGGHLSATTAIWNAVHSKAPTVATILSEHIEGLAGVTARGRADYRRDAAN